MIRRHPERSEGSGGDQERRRCARDPSPCRAQDDVKHSLHPALSIFENHYYSRQGAFSMKRIAIVGAVCLFCVTLWAQGGEPTAVIDTTVGKLTCKLFS